MRSTVVLADAQFSTMRIMRPPSGFESIYEGESALIPLYLFPRGKNARGLRAALDPQAGEPGYDPRLIRGIAVPTGARVLLKVPNILYLDELDPVPVLRAYRYSFIWRDRNLFDYRTQRIPWHLPRGQGPDDTTFTPPQERVVIPAHYQTVVYNNPQPVSSIAPDSLRAIQTARAEDITFGAVRLFGPFLDAALTAGVVQQGIEDPGSVGALATTPGFMWYEMSAIGDELIIAISRDNTNVPDWGFDAGAAFPGNADAFLSALLGNGTGEEFPDVGVYVQTGTAP